MAYKIGKIKNMQLTSFTFSPNRDDFREIPHIFASWIIKVLTI